MNRLEHIYALLDDIGGIVTLDELDYQLRRQSRRLRLADVDHLVAAGLVLRSTDGVEVHPEPRTQPLRLSLKLEFAQAPGQWLSTPTLERLIGCHRRSLHRRLHELRDEGFLDHHREGRRDAYRLIGAGA